MEHRQEISYQLDLFVEQKQNDIRSSDNRKDVNQAKARKAVQVNKEGQQGRALTGNLMTIICSSTNLKQAYKQVKRNKGVAGIDQKPTAKFADWFKENGDTLINELLQGTYKPQAVKTGRNTQTQRRNKETWNSHRNRPYYPTIHSPGFKSDLRAGIFKFQLRISPQTQSHTSLATSKNKRVLFAK